MVHPETGEPVRRVHTFLRKQHNQNVHWGRIATLARTVQVADRREQVCSTQSLVVVVMDNRGGCESSKTKEERGLMQQKNVKI